MEQNSGDMAQNKNNGSLQTDKYLSSNFTLIKFDLNILYTKLKLL